MFDPAIFFLSCLLLNFHTSEFTRSRHTHAHTLQHNCLMNRHKFVKRFLVPALLYGLHFVRPIYWQFLSASYETLSYVFQFHLLLLLLLPSFLLCKFFVGGVGKTRPHWQIMRLHLFAMSSQKNFRFRCRLAFIFLPPSDFPFAKFQICHHSIFFLGQLWFMPGCLSRLLYKTLRYEENGNTLHELGKWNLYASRFATLCASL